MNTTKYGTLFDTLKSEILSGKYRSDFPFPSVRALINRFKLSDRTVRHALDELVGQGLISRKQGRGTFVTGSAVSRRIGLIMPDSSQTEYFMRIVRELIRLADQKQYTLLFGEISGRSTNERARKTESVVRDFIQQRVAGVIYQPIEYYKGGESFNCRILMQLKRALVPVVLCDNDIEGGNGLCDVVGNDNVEAGARMYRYLTSKGARKPCYFMRPFAPQTHFDRLRGLLLARLPKFHGKIGNDAFLVCEPDDVNAIRRRIRTKGVDAFMCSDDETAAKLMQTLNAIGYSVPGDILVTGFNDLQIANLLSPALTTLRVSCEDIARAAFTRLVHRISDPKLPPTRIYLPVELIERESTVRMRKKAKG